MKYDSYDKFIRFHFIVINHVLVFVVLFLHCLFILQENLVERKHHRQNRSVRSGLSDRDAKPTAAVRDQLHTIVCYPPTTTLTSEEQDLVWKYRFYLTSHKKALTKFLKCINWETNSEVRQAIILLKQWTPMDVEDALELLSPAFKHSAVRG